MFQENSVYFAALFHYELVAKVRVVQGDLGCFFPPRGCHKIIGKAKDCINNPLDCWM